jgi:hypothetical protein
MFDRVERLLEIYGGDPQWYLSIVGLFREQYNT